MNKGKTCVYISDVSSRGPASKLKGFYSTSVNPNTRLLIVNAGFNKTSVHVLKKYLLKTIVQLNYNKGW